MADDQPSPPPSVHVDFGKFGGPFRFNQADELQRWNTEESQKWLWLADAGRPTTEWLADARHKFHTRIEELAVQWARARETDSATYITKLITHQFSEAASRRQLLFSTSAAAQFIFTIKENRGNQVAGGAYASILKAAIIPNSQIFADFFEGVFEGFLFKREIEWTASSHQKELERLKNRYEEEAETQKIRSAQIESDNTDLVQKFADTLRERHDLLETLHIQQTGEFSKLRDEHVNKLKAIEDTYQHKLALRAPVEYWQAKETLHRKKAQAWSIAALLSIIGLAVGSAFLVRWVFGDLAETQNPKHWQIGLMIVATFFSVWIVRILVRMFLSHHHLAIDAAERRTMIQTYLSLSLEGAPIAPEDRKLIMQHIFRSASDGLVKDDASPPSWFNLVQKP